LNRDDSKFKLLELYPKDDLRFVKAIKVEGDISDSDFDRTFIKIFGKI